MLAEETTINFFAVKKKEYIKGGKKHFWYEYINRVSNKTFMIYRLLSSIR